MLNFIDGLFIGMLIIFIINQVGLEKRKRELKKIVDDTIKQMNEAVNELPFDEEIDDE